MSSERAIQNRLIKLFTNPNQLDNLGYDYLGNWQYETGKSNIEEPLLRSWLVSRDVSETLITRTLHTLNKTCSIGGGRSLYDANKEIYSLLRYGVKVKETAGEQNQTVWLIDWENPENNHFGLAEEVTVKGPNDKRPDLVLYVNGIALGVIELKRSSVSVEAGIRQNLDNQKNTFIQPFFTTMQLVMAGNDSQSLRYGTIETPEKHYYKWKEQEETIRLDEHDLDHDIRHICNKKRFLEIIHDFTVFDQGIKKLARQNQYFGVKAAQKRVATREGGVIWHTQGSGKSLTMVWLAKWLRENQTNARVLLITDRTELDEQIEGVFIGVDEEIYRTKSGNDLIATLNEPNEWLICSLVHKFGGKNDESEDIEEERDKASEDFIKELQASIPSDFEAKGNLFVFVDECHRTQSGALHSAMKALLPTAMFIGFTGTPLLKKDKQTSEQVFGTHIHKYKFDEAVEDGVVLDLRYEARDIDQYVSSPKRVDEWFDAKTKGLTESAKNQLKLKWGSMQKILSSKERQARIVEDINMDMARLPRLNDGRGNAMLVCASVYQACKIYEMFSGSDLAGKCAIITSYKPSAADIKGEETGAGQTEKLHKYDIYRKMLADYFQESEDEAVKKVEVFEEQVKEKFVKEPGQMRLLIVVDKLLTGFDAPSATYLYIDKTMKDHGLFQAICRVNRLDGDDKEYGYIIDYKDLFKKLEGAIEDYTVGALDGYDKEDVQGLLTDRLEKGREDLELARETVKAVCEPVLEPKEEIDFHRYFCDDIAKDKEGPEFAPRRVLFYKAVVSLVRAYARLANEMEEAGYSKAETEQVKSECKFYSDQKRSVEMRSNDYVDMKKYEPAMRQLLDQYVRAEDSDKVESFEELGLIELIVQRGAEEAINATLGGSEKTEEAMSETIEANMRKIITDEQQTNPAYFDKMSVLLDELIEARRKEALDYRAYLAQVKELAIQIKNRGGAISTNYPVTIDTSGKKALYDNLEQNENLVVRLDTAIRHNKEADWIGNTLRERKVKFAILDEIGEFEDKLDAIFKLVKQQAEYR